MAAISYQWRGDGIARLIATADILAGPKKTTALRRAVNHTGRKTFTQVKRTLAKQMGLASQRMLANGRTLRPIPATGASLEFVIRSTGRAVPAKEFKHSASKRNGVTFYPWGVAHRFPSAFEVGKFGGNFYRRRGPARFPIERLLGPNINKELVKDATAAAFESVVSTSLAPRVEHEVRVITNGVVS